MSNKNQDDNHNSDDWWYDDYSRMKRSMYESDPTLDPDYEKNASDYQPKISGGSLYPVDCFLRDWIIEKLVWLFLSMTIITIIGYVIYGVYWLICYLFRYI